MGDGNKSPSWMSLEESRPNINRWVDETFMCNRATQTFSSFFPFVCEDSTTEKIVHVSISAISASSDYFIQD